MEHTGSFILFFYLFILYFFLLLQQMLCKWANHAVVSPSEYNFLIFFREKRGRKYNLVVHNDDNNDLSTLGLSMSKSTSSLNDTHDESDGKDLDQDNKDAKSDAGFCTGSDTGSDGVFAEDNISDTSSALVSMGLVSCLINVLVHGIIFKNLDLLKITKLP